MKTFFRILLLPVALVAAFIVWVSEDDESFWKLVKEIGFNKYE